MSNPIITDTFTADPTVILHNNTIYLYTGHDEPPAEADDYVMKNWLCFSSEDMKLWKAHPSPLKATDFSWARGDAYASKVIERDGKFYWYAAVTHATIPGKAIGVAVSDHPEGPFKDALGAALINTTHIPPTNNEKANLDPSVIIDDDGQAYIFWGSKQCYYAKLKKNMTALDGPVLLLSLPGFMEGTHVYKRNGWFYLMYGYEFPEKVGYAMSKNIHGPWEFKGIVNDVVFNCETNRAATVDFHGKSWFFYHNGALPNGGSHKRSVCVEEMRYLEDGTVRLMGITG